MFENTKDMKSAQAEFAQIYTVMAKLMGDGKLEQMSPNRLTGAVAEAIGIYPVPNMAVEHCTRAFTQAAEKATADGMSTDHTRKAAQLAYALAIPPLTGADSIGDFIACVTQGMLLGAIPGSDATRLLYAAQVAHSAFPKRKNLMKMLQKSSKKKAATSAASTTSAGKREKNADPSPSPTPKAPSATILASTPCLPTVAEPRSATAGTNPRPAPYPSVQRPPSRRRPPCAVSPSA